MSLTRIYTTLAETIVRKIGAAGGPPASRVDQELNNIITWAAASPRNIRFDTSVANSSGAVLTNLHSFNVLAGTLATNNDYLTIEYGGNYASNANTKRVVFSVGGTSYEDTGLLDIEALGWAIRGKIVRLSATSVLVHTVFEAGILVTNAAGANVVTAIGGRMNQRSATLTVSDLGANALTLLLQGQGTANNDVTQYLSIIELRQQ